METITSNVVGMRITGFIGSEEYRRRFGQPTQIDRWIIQDLRDGLLEFDPHTEKLYVTALGHRHLYQLDQQRLDEFH